MTITRSEDGAATAGFAAAGALGLPALVAAGAGLAALLALLAGPVAALDRAAAAAAERLVAPHPQLVAALQALTPLGAQLTAAVVLATLATALAIRHRPRLAVYAVVTGLGGVVLGPLLDAVVALLRPGAPAALPSGHALTATVWVGVVLLVLLPAVAARARGVVVATGVVLVLVAGLSRVALGVHQLSDVLAGWLLGGAWLALTATAFRGLHGPGPRPRGAGLDPGAARDLAPPRTTGRGP